MRIVINGLAAKGEGGLTYLLNLLPELPAIASDCKVVVYVNSKAGRTVHARLNGRLDHVTIREVAVESRLRRLLWEETTLPKVLRDEQTDVLFVPSPALPGRCGCASVIAIRNMEAYCEGALASLGPRERAHHHYRRWSTDRALRQANRVILVSEATVPLLRQRHTWNLDRTVVVYHGRDRLFEPMARGPACDLVRERFGVSKPFVLYISKTRPYKRHKELVEAMAELSRRGRGELLVIAGECQQPYYGEVSARIRTLGLTDRVHWLGDVEQRLLPALYNAAALLAFPSTCEACPNILIEAMACGLPILASDIAVVREITAGAAMYRDATDPASLADGLELLLLNPDLRSDYRSRALRRAEDFSWRRTAERTMEVLRQAAADANRSQPLSC